MKPTRLGLIVGAAAAFAVALLASTVAQAQPTGWSHAQEFDVTEQSNTLLTNYPVELSVDTQTLIAAAQMNADGSDIRFGLDCAGNQSLDHWLGGGINTTNTEIWVLLPQLQASATVTIYMYYGNVSAPDESDITIFDGPYSSTDAGSGPITGGNSGGSPDTGRGFRFSPNRDVLVAELGKNEPNGTMRDLTIWNYTTQTILYQHTSTAGTAATYTYDLVTQAFWLDPNGSYISSIQQHSGDGYFFQSSSQISPYLTYQDMRYCNSCNSGTFPTNVLGNYHYGYSDFLFYIRPEASAEPSVTPLGPACGFTCGNGTPEGSEQCDDGNNNNCDSCSNACTNITGCGDGETCGNEVCDDGNTANCDGCRGDCSAVETGCGDTFLCGNEGCDDGNTVACDGCSATCVIETGCGDGALGGNEGCDDGNTVDCDGCSATCVIETGCGDGALCGNEGCDDGNTVDCDGCSATCVTETGCGDGAVCGSEGCDDGNTVDCDGCSATCMTETGCGDGALCGTEICDDGNTVDCDGCSADCSVVESGCGDGVTCGNEACDDGNAVPCDGCSADCSIAETGCGDGAQCGTELCDDGNNVDCDGCSADCSVLESGCGDGVLCGSEQCDDGNIADGDGCSSSCMNEGAGGSGGGTSSGTGGASSSGTGGASSSGTGGSSSDSDDDTTDDGGCGCHLVGKARSGNLAALGLLGLLGLALTRRRRAA